MYNIVQVFDRKWVVKKMGPTSHVAFKNVLTIDEAKALGRGCLQWPTIGIQIHDMETLRVAAVCGEDGHFTDGNN